MLDLHPFDETAQTGAAVRAHAERGGSLLRLRYHLPLAAGDAWRVPRSTSAPMRRDRLWEHTCLEAFVSTDTAAAYWEVNVAPSGHWNVYRFDGPRRGMRPETRVEPPVVERSGDGETEPLTLTATFDLGPIPELATAPLQVGLAAVTEAPDGTLAYWALRHRGPRPDFHDRDAFLVRLPMPSEARA
jgi:hypothetical protein